MFVIIYLIFLTSAIVILWRDVKNLQQQIDEFNTRLNKDEHDIDYVKQDIT